MGRENVDMLSKMVANQSNLMLRYHRIEKDNGQLETGMYPLNLDDRQSQARLRNFAWRFVEEMAEAMVEDYNKEEVIDALHFLLEISIMLPKEYMANLLAESTERIEGLPTYGLETDSLNTIYLAANGGQYARSYGTTIPVVTCNLFTHLGMMINTLKVKPWRQTEVETDLYKFQYHFNHVWWCYFNLIRRLDITTTSLFELYMAKNMKNQKRQDDKY